MKRIGLLYLSLLLLMAGCGGEEVQTFEVSSFEAFAYEISDGVYEVNCSIVAANFAVAVEGEEYSAKLEYTIDVFSPDASKSIPAVRDTVVIIESEKPAERKFDAQFELRPLQTGIYRLALMVNGLNGGEALAETQVTIDAVSEQDSL